MFKSAIGVPELRPEAYLKYYVQEGKRSHVNGAYFA
jgi:hypothetical protein